MDDKTTIYRELLDAVLRRPADRNGFDEEALECIRPFVSDKRTILLAFPPKCGGTFLGRVLGTLLSALNPPGGRAVLRGSFMGDGGSERDLYFPELLAHSVLDEGRFAVIHNHPTATDGNLALIELFGIKPVVMRRNIADMLTSGYDAAVKRGSLGDFGSCFPEDETFLELPLEDQKDFLVHNYAPWYVKYYASWYLAQQRGRIRDLLFVDFDDFKNDAGEVVRSILAVHGIDAEREAIDAVLGQAHCDRSRLRFNKGVSGRGREFFSAAQLEHLERLTGQYRTIDFRAEGLIDAQHVTSS